MDHESINLRLSKISTIWSDVAHAHDRVIDVKSTAQRALIERYQQAIYRFLLGGLRNPDVADDAFQEFALDFVRGGFRNVDPNRGRFRDYLKSALVHLISRYRKRGRVQIQSLDVMTSEPATVGPEESESDQRFVQIWRSELLARAWTGLQLEQQRTGQPFYDVLRFRSLNRNVPSPEMARQLTEQLRPATPFTDTGIRKMLQRAREKFAHILLDEVVRTMEQATPEQLEQELIDLGLLEYCRPAMQRHFSRDMD